LWTATPATASPRPTSTRPDRLGGGLLDHVPHVQLLHLPGRPLRPAVISWPAGIRARGEVRHQCHHAIDIVPTILDCCGVEFPDCVLGYEQTPLLGVSMRYSFDDADAPTAKKVQYYEMLGTRGLWSEGWKVVAAMPVAPIPPGGIYVYYPGTLEVPEFTAANTRGRSYKILAEVQFTNPDAHGVLLAQGARFGGHARFVKDRKLSGMSTTSSASRPSSSSWPTAGSNRATGSWGRVHQGAARGAPRGPRHRPAVRGRPGGGRGATAHPPGHFAIAGEGLSVGRDGGDAVSKESPRTSPKLCTTAAPPCPCR
jgi:hypothetical protein